MKRTTLREIAHARSGEKGRGSNISVIAYDPKDYEILRSQVTVAAVAKLYGPITKGSITRYEVSASGALNFVLEDVLEGGRTRTLAFEEGGKALSSLMLTMPLEVPDDFVGRAQKVAAGLKPVYAVPTFSTGKRVRLGSGSAWSRDRFEPAEDLVERGNLDYLCFDAMSEITMSMAQVARMDGSTALPYDPMLDMRLGPLLKPCKEKGVKIITNAGWLDPVAAAERILEMARQQGIKDLKVGAVCGGILTDKIADMDLNFTETRERIADYRSSIVSAEAYLGAEGIVEALRQGADVVITTRVADACVYLGPLIHEFNWDMNDHDLMSKGMIIGHLMECGSQVCGGYFADPGYKDVPDLDEIGNPIAEVSADRILITKLPGTGGIVSAATCKEQLLYEVQDPARYFCPDVIADFTKVHVREVGKDEVEVIADKTGAPKTSTLKALVGLSEGFMTEEMALFAGPGALERAEMTKALLQKRFKKVNLQATDLRFDYVGINSVHREASPVPTAAPYEVILRIGLKTTDKKEAEKLRREIDPLAVNGVSGNGKWATAVPGSRVRPLIGLNSTLVPRGAVPFSVVMRQ